MAGINRKSGVQTSPQGQSEGRFGGGQGLVNMTTVGRSDNYGQWHPTVVFLLLLVLAEVAGYGALRYAFRSVHGG